MTAAAASASSSSSPSKGIVIQLSAEAAESLRSSRNQRRNSGVAVPRGGEEEDWDDVIPVASHQHLPQQQQQHSSSSFPAVATPDNEEGSYRSCSSDLPRQRPKSASDEGSQSDDADTDNDDEGDNESALSAAPPASLPVVLVDLSRLVGYAPQTATEATQIAEQVRTALHVNDGDFETRVSELFESRLARHSTTTTATPDHRSLRLLSVAAIDYPTALPRGGSPYLSDASPLSLLSTPRLWKRLLRRHPIPIVQHVLDRLRDCNRTLTWKVAMRREIVTLACAEERYRDWNRWTREGRRRNELEKLYRVRDTLQFQVETAEERVQTLIDAREVEVQRVLTEQRERGGIGGLGTFDLESTLFSFPHTYMGVRDEPLYTEEDNDDEEEADPYSLLSDYSDEEEPDVVSQSDDGDYSNGDDSGNDGNDDDDDSAAETAPLGQSDSSDKGEDPEVVGCPAMSDPPTDAATPQHPPIGVRRNRRRRGPHVTRAHRERWQDAAREAEHAAHWIEARKAEEAVRDACTSPALASAEAVVAALQKRLQQVDDLLESLQDEEWQAEESGSEDESETSSKEVVARPEKARASPEQKAPTPSVLDDILAMILGATTLPLESDEEGEAASSGEAVEVRRRAWLRSEHRSIVEGWREHFGRVPPPLERAATHRASAPSPVSGTNAPPRATQPKRDNHDSDGVWHLGSPGRGRVDDKLGQPAAVLLSHGLPNQVLDDWEDATDDDDEDQAATNEVGGPPTTLPPGGRRSRGGLRPGGRAP